MNIIKELSDISRTNQIKITASPETVATQLFQYLFKINKGIESFSCKNPDLSEYDDSSLSFFQKRHRFIKQEIKKRLATYDENNKSQDIQYFLSSFEGESTVFFLSPNKSHSGWTELFIDNQNNQEKILNLVFKVYLLSQELPLETVTGFEKLLLIHSLKSSKSGESLFVWGYELFLNYNKHNVLTLKLSRKNRKFLQKDQYITTDSDDLGELLIYNNKNYYFERNLDARRKNDLYFMQFPKDQKDYDSFKKTQLYHYQNLITKLENFLNECKIAFQSLEFQANRYLKNPFIQNIESVDSLEIINNTGTDFNELEQQFLKTSLKHQGIADLTFYHAGKTISKYNKIKGVEENDICWEMTEVIPWSEIKLEKEKNYLIVNKALDEEIGSMAYLGDDNFWYSSSKITSRNKVDLYSQLKRKFSYLEIGEFFSMQGINVSEFKIIGTEQSDSVFNYTPHKLDQDTLRQDTRDFTGGKFLDVEDSIACYLTKQQDSQIWRNFCNRYRIKLSPKFQKVLIELGIKNWIRKSLTDPKFTLPITSQSFSEKEFFAIYVRSPNNKETQAVAVEFLYQDGKIYIKNVLRDLKEIKNRFRFLRSRKSHPEKLIDNQHYFVDESEKLYISCYTDDRWTPTLIGRNGILEEMESGELEINRTIQSENASKLLPLVSYYNSVRQPINQIKNMICLDSSNKTFIQYFVPPVENLKKSLKTGFRVYHLIGKTYSGESRDMTTSELLANPLAALHFSTLTQNVLKINDNSQSSLLQKVTKILIEN